MLLFRKIKSYLLHNTSTKQTIVKNTFRLLIAEWVSKGSLFLISILIARQLGPEQFGVMSFVISFVSMFIILTDLGLTTLMVREVSRDQSKLAEYFVNGNFLKILLGILTFWIVWCVSLFIGKPDLYISLILIYCGYAIVNNIGEFIRSFFRPSEHMQYEALLKIINGILVLLIIWFTLWMGYGLQSIFYAYLLAGAVSLLISIWFVLWKKAINSLKTIQYSFLTSCIKSWFYLWLGNFFVSIYISFDQIILWYYDSNYNLWLYAFAYKITMIYAIVSSVVFSILLPRTAKNNYIKNIKDNYIRWLKKIAIYNTLIVIWLEIIVFLTYYFNLVDFWAYRQSLIILMLLLIYCMFEPLWYRWFINLVSIWKEKKTTIIFLISAFINLVGNLILIPIIWYYWAIITTILSYSIFFLLTLWYLKNIFIKEVLVK